MQYSLERQKNAQKPRREYFLGYLNQMKVADVVAKFFVVTTPTLLYQQERKNN